MERTGKKKGAALVEHERDLLEEALRRLVTAVTKFAEEEVIQGQRNLEDARPEYGAAQCEEDNAVAHARDVLMQIGDEREARGQQ